MTLHVTYLSFGNVLRLYTLFCHLVMPGMWRRRCLLQLLIFFFLAFTLRLNLLI